MATPTPGKPPTVAATPPVSTPFSQSHLTAFSPHAARSSMVPSPQQVRKSPANSNTLYGHPTNSSFGAINFDSPSAAAALGLGDMSMVMPIMPKREDDQKVKVEQIIETFWPVKGRITEDGLESLIRRLGLTFFWDTEFGNPGVKKLFAAGIRTFSIEIKFIHGAVDTVVLDIIDANASVIKYKDKAAEVFRRNLDYPPGKGPLTTMLDRFCENLERFSTLDKLSVTPGLHCHEAVLGIHDSLERIYNWEVAQMKEEDIAAGNGPSKPASLYDHWLSRRVMCTKSGRPAMHTQMRVGLSIEYWQEKHLISTSPDSVQLKTWTMMVECAEAPDVSFSNPPEQPYGRVRVSDAWVSPRIKKADPTPEDIMNNTLLDWLEPDIILLPATNGSKMSLNPTELTKIPDVMFSAKFEPSLAIPNYIADWIYHVIQATPSLFPVLPHVVAVDRLILPLSAGEMDDPGGSRRIQRHKNIPVLDSHGTKMIKLHRNTLLIPRFDPGYELRNLPFSHPRQLVEILPYLRQYAFLATLLRKSFGGPSVDATLAPGATKHKTTTRLDQLTRFMHAADVDDPAVPLDVTLLTESGGTMQPPFRNPTLTVTFPFGARCARLVCEIGLNGAVAVVEENVLPTVDGAMRHGHAAAAQSLTKAHLAAMLEMSEDLGVFAEYVCRRLG